MRLLKREIVRRGASTTLPILKKSAFEKLDIPVPPLDAQTSFVERVVAVGEQIKSAREQSAHLDDLFASLQQRAFRGEL